MSEGGNGRARQVAVIGASRCAEGSEPWRPAGILPGSSLGEANPHCTHVVATDIGHGRNLAVVASGETVIAVGGEWGTLSEIGFARSLGRTVVALRSWELIGREAMDGAPGVIPADDPAEAVAAALAALNPA